MWCETLVVTVCGSSDLMLRCNYFVFLFWGKSLLSGGSTPSYLRAFEFKHLLMRTPISEAFEECVLAVAGLQSSSDLGGLLSSLPCELTFNVLRDSARRHAKHERSAPSAIHSLAVKTCEKHPCGCDGLQLCDEDWSESLQRSAIKKHIHEALRVTDRDLGISCEGLTRHKSNRYTKPHVLAQRLELLQVLSDIYHDTAGRVIDKEMMVKDTYTGMWVSKLVPELWLLRKENDVGEESPCECLITTNAGPFVIGCMSVRKNAEGNYKLEESPRVRVVATDFKEWQVAQCKPVCNPDLGWERSGPWMSLLDYIADFGILHMPATLLGCVVTKLKLKKGRLDHVLLAELLLRHMGRSEDWISEVVEQLKAKQRKRKERREQAKKEQQLDGEDRGKCIVVRSTMLMKGCNNLYKSWVQRNARYYLHFVHYQNVQFCVLSSYLS